MEDFVNFELAKKLKEKGFNWTCSHYYRTKSKDLFMIFPREDWSNIEERINAPTISQVLKWLRKEKKIHITANMYQDESEDTDGRIVDKWCFWNWVIQSCISGNILQDGDDAEYESYESATLAGIEYAINNLI